jgi:predicted RNase H-like HicB family nuclease
MRRYRVTIEHDQETGTYWAQVPALPGCFTQGDTIDDVLANLQEAITGHLAALRTIGQPIPEGDAPAGEEPIHLTVTVAA